MLLYRPTLLFVACILLSQAAKTFSVQHNQVEGEPTDAKAKSTRGSGLAALEAEKPVIVIAGLCDRGNVKRSSECRTVITREQFEMVIAAIQPDMPRRARRAFALSYADALVMVQKAEQMGLDRGENFEEQMKIARIDILTRALRNQVQARASQIPEEEIEAYYKGNRRMFEKAEVDRLYIPRKLNLGSDAASRIDGGKLQESATELEKKSRGEADTLHASAASGASFAALQVQAYRNAGIQSAAPETNMWIRNISLPPSQRLVMDLQPGEVSSVLNDPNGYMIYRMIKKELLPLDQVHDQIEEILRSQRMQEGMQAILNTATTTLSDAYFGPNR